MTHIHIIHEKQRRGTNLKIQLSITRSEIATTRYVNSTVRTRNGKTGTSLMGFDFDDGFQFHVY